MTREWYKCESCGADGAQVVDMRLTNRHTDRVYYGISNKKNLLGFALCPHCADMLIDKMRVEWARQFRILRENGGRNFYDGEWGSDDE